LVHRTGIDPVSLA